MQPRTQFSWGQDGHCKRSSSWESKNPSLNTWEWPCIHQLVPTARCHTSGGEENGGAGAGSSVLMCLHSELDACLLPVAVTTYAFLLSTWSKAFRNSESSSYEHSGPQTHAIRTSIEARGGAVYAWHRGRALEHEEKQSQLLSNHGIYANLQPLAIWEFSF